MKKNLNMIYVEKMVEDKEFGLEDVIMWFEEQARDNNQDLMMGAAEFMESYKEYEEHGECKEYEDAVERKGLDIIEELLGGKDGLKYLLDNINEVKRALMRAIEDLKEDLEVLDGMRAARLLKIIVRLSKKAGRRLVNCVGASRPIARISAGVILITSDRVLGIALKAAWKEIDLESELGMVMLPVAQ